MEEHLEMLKNGCIDKDGNQCREYYKDFCTCNKEQQYEKKEKSVQRTIDLLNENNLKYVNYGSANVVKVFNHPKYETVILSLKPKINKLKIRFEGNNKWYEIYKGNFFESLRKEKENEDANEV